MVRKIYKTLILISITLVVYHFIIKEPFSEIHLIIVASLIFMLLSISIHGLLAHYIKVSIKKKPVIYSLFMGVVWSTLFLVFLLFFLSIFYPDFLLDL